ncbi:hypothetical protein PsYK624_120300 [Phanerochaete sordida]|uniref:Uncharacterized protein n=1 Tax=Phanerochaete sordida TaxID=48140 RepID=A0A9P3GIQ1_9APHY|nr:hypothetical protein PsYK624_120300 [Phanerochaete sordida]
MCFQGNAAPMSASYINSQLAILWKNAHDCAADEVHGNTDPSPNAGTKSAYTRALYEYQYIPESHAGLNIARSDAHFYATFGQPELKFICNHEAVLSLTLKSGHLRVDYDAKKVNGLGTNQLVKQLPELKAHFRVPFERTNVKGHDTKIGNDTATHLIRMVALKFEEAVFVKLDAADSWGLDFAEALAFYLRGYLAFLTLSGNHVLFDLPDFAAHEKIGYTDYALLRDHVDPDEFCKDVAIFGVTTKVINSFLETQWAGAKKLAREKNDYLVASVAELSSNWLTHYAVDCYSYIRFGAPKIKPLCPHEVILFLDVQDVAMFQTTDFERSAPVTIQHGWTVAFVVNVMEYDSNVGVLELDFSTARYASAFSTPPPASEPKILEYYNLLVKFLTVDYLDILLAYSYNIIYRLVIDKHPDVIAGSGFWKRVEHVGEYYSFRRHGQALIWIERVRDLALSGADQVLALTEDSVNRILRTRREALGTSHLLSTWSKDSFKADFNPLTVRILSNGKVVVFVDIVHAESGPRILQTELSPVVDNLKEFWKSKLWGNAVVTTDLVKAYHFEHVTLAFEVDLQLLETLDVDEVVAKQLNTTVASQVKPNQRVLVKHLVLNLANAKYIGDLSDAYNLGAGREGEKRLMTIKSLISSYLAEVGRSGCGILKTIPTYIDDVADPFALKDIAFKVLTKDAVTIEHYVTGSHLITDTPVIAIYGVCTKRALPPFVGRWSLGWLPTSGPRDTAGIVCFSKESFLEQRLLHALEDFNARTTVLPKFAGLVNGSWSCDLTTWYENELLGKRGVRCLWKEVATSSSRYLEYVWEHRDDWAHENDATTRIEGIGEYSLGCHTENRLWIPTDYRPGRQLEIELKGKSTVEISGHAYSQRWSKRTVSTWSATIVIASQTDGLHVSMTTQLQPAEVEGDDRASAAFPFNVEALHKSRLPDKLSALDGLLPRLRDVLEGPWAYASFGVTKFAFVNPVFTRRGDFVVELCPYEQGTAVARPQPTVISTPVPPSSLSSMSNASNVSNMSSSLFSGTTTLNGTSFTSSGPVPSKPTQFVLPNYISSYSSNSS